MKKCALVILLLSLLFTGATFAQMDLSTPGGQSVLATFVTDPVGAEVYVAGTFIGNAPASVRINANTNTPFTIRIPGGDYQDFSGTVNLAQAGVTNVYVPRVGTVQTPAPQATPPAPQPAPPVQITPPAQTTPPAFNRQMATCAGLQGELTRLDCYDTLAVQLGLTVQTSTTSSGRWEVSTKTNPLDDSRTVLLATEAIEGVNSYGQAPVLILRCQSGETEMYIVWNEYLGSDDAYVISRVGNGSSINRLWSLSSDNEATFYPGNETGVINHITELINTNRYVTQTTPYNESPITAVFDVSGLAQSIRPLRETCSW